MRFITFMCAEQILYSIIYNFLSVLFVLLLGELYMDCGIPMDDPEKKKSYCSVRPDAGGMTAAYICHINNNKTDET